MQPQTDIQIKKVFSGVTISPGRKGQTLLEATDVFKANRGFLLKNQDGWEPKRPAGKLESVSCDVYEMQPGSNADFSHIYEKMKTLSSRTLLTQEQIVAYCKEHRDKLSPMGSNFFFFQELHGEKSEVLCAYVHFYAQGASEELAVWIRGKDEPSPLWEGKDHNRIFIPIA